MISWFATSQNPSKKAFCGEGEVNQKVILESVYNLNRGCVSHSRLSLIYSSTS